MYKISKYHFKAAFSSIWVLLILFIATPLSAQTNSVSSISDKIWLGIGGKSAWESSRYFSFSFTVINSGNKVFSRKHLWDRYSGDYRLQYMAKDSSSILVLFNTNTKKGKVFRNLAEIKDDSLSNIYLLKAYNSFVNDTYWLVMPAKIEDPGVILSALNDTLINNLFCSSLALRFQNGIGNTSGDCYEIFLNQKNNEIIQWAYLLQGEKEKQFLNWSSYKNIGGLKLSLLKTSIDKKFAISLEDAIILPTVSTLLFFQP